MCHRTWEFNVTSPLASSSTSFVILSSCPTLLEEVFFALPLRLLARRCLALVADLRDDVVLPNRSRIRLAGRNRQGPSPRRRDVPPPRALDAASAHRCRSTPARDGYARRNNGSTSGQRSAVATDISACSVARVAGGGRARGGRGEQDARAGGGQSRSRAMEAGRARSCSYTVKVRRCRAKVSGELAGAVAPSGAEVRDVGRAVTSVSAWCRGRGLGGEGRWLACERGQPQHQSLRL